MMEDTYYQLEEALVQGFQTPVPSLQGAKGTL